MNRIASRGLVGAAALCAGLAAGAVSAVKAATARNPYVTVSGEVEFKEVSDDAIHISRLNGPTLIGVSPRPGWRLEGPTNVVLSPGGRVALQFSGKDGEEGTGVELDDDGGCDHRSEENTWHSKDQKLVADPAESHVLALYTDPDVGVPIDKSFGWKIDEVGTHTTTIVDEPCPYCDFGHGDNVRTHVTTIPPTPPYQLEYIFGNDLVENRYPAGNHQFSCIASWSSSDCPEDRCKCSAKAVRKYIVGYAALQNTQYLGLDMTDEGKLKDQTGNVDVKNNIPCGDPECVLTTEPHCVFENNSAKTTGFKAEFHPKERTIPSSTYRGESVEALVTARDGDGCEASLTLGGKFTIVRVDVSVDETNENDDETKGPLICYYPDREDGSLSADAIAGLRPVTFEVLPKDLPAEQTVEITAPEKTLYVKTGDGYAVAKKVYTLRELGETRFFLHGHEPSDLYLGDEIRITHPLSKALDVGKFTVLGQPELVPDYDRDGKIDENDEAKADDGKTVFRFWINDDNDSGDICDADDYCDDAPYRFHRDCDDIILNSVDGRRDLVDWTPVWVDLSEVFPEDTPQSVKDGVSWYLKSPCLNATWTDLKTEEVSKFQTADLFTCGKKFDTLNSKAGTVKLKEKAELPDKFRELALSKSRRGVAFVEGAAAGEGLRVFGEVDKTKLVAIDDLKIKVSGVEEMFRWVGIRDALNVTNRANHVESPKNWPDEECDDRMFVLVHGFNVNEEEALSSGAEVFKRLWQSGLKSSYTVVSWYGNVGQSVNLPELGTVSLSYYVNCCNAFMSSDALAKRCNALPKRKIMIGHSLGNVLTCSAIVDHNLKYSKYAMLNAALAKETLGHDPVDPGKAEADMIEEDWQTVYFLLTSPWWHELFGNDDFRHCLTWKNRFSGITGIVNYYSDTEDVVCNRVTGPIHKHVWTGQELNKGTLLMGTLDLALDTPSEGGWGIAHRWDIKDYRKGRLVDCVPKSVGYERFKVDPLFSKFSKFELDEKHAIDLHTNAVLRIADADTAYRLRAKILSDGIPAESFACGANEVNDINNHELSRFIDNADRWPQKDGAKCLWTHSAFKNVAYFFMKNLYDNLLELQ